MILEDWGVRLFLAGMGLGIAVMTFVVSFDSTAAYQQLVAPTVSGATRPLGYVLDGSVLLAFAMTVAGTACFTRLPLATPSPPAERPMSAAEHLAELRRQKVERARQVKKARKGRVPASAHGST